jgi:hypothetical protein
MPGERNVEQLNETLNSPSKEAKGIAHLRDSAISKKKGNKSLARRTELAPPGNPVSRTTGKSAGRQLIADLSAQVRDSVSAADLINTLKEVHEGRRPIPRRMQHPLTGEIYLDESGEIPRASDRIAAARELKEWGWGKNPIQLDMDKHVQVSVGVDVNRLSARDARAFLELSRKARGELTSKEEAADVVEGVYKEADVAQSAPTGGEVGGQGPV